MSPSRPLNPFHAATLWNRDGSGRWKGTLTPDWTQGKTAFGGFVLAGALRALQTLAGPDRQPRSISAALMDKLDVGGFTSEGEVLRAGKNVTVAEARVHQNGRHAATVLATFGVCRTSSVAFDEDQRPERPGAAELPEIPYLEGVMPPCQQHFETRYTDGSVPFSGYDAVECGGWIRLRHPKHRSWRCWTRFPSPSCNA